MSDLGDALGDLYATRGDDAAFEAAVTRYVREARREAFDDAVLAVSSCLSRTDRVPPVVQIFAEWAMDAIERFDRDNAP